MQITEVSRIDLSNRSRSSTALRPAHAAKGGAGADIQGTCRVRDRNSITCLGSPHQVLVAARRAQALVVGRADDPAGIDHALEARYAVVDLPGRIRIEIGAQFTRRIRLRGGTGGIAEARGAMAPGEQWANRARRGRCDHDAGHDGGGTAEVGARVRHLPRASPANRRRDFLTRL